jgi:hypothetical protein
MSLGYRYTVDEAGCEAFHHLSRRQRQHLLRLFSQLAAHPFTRGDYRQPGTRGEIMEVSLFENEFLVTWCSDHAAKQVCILRVEVI